VLGPAVAMSDFESSGSHDGANVNNVKKSTREQAEDKQADPVR